MTTYASIRNNNFGQYTDNTLDFKPEIDLTYDESVTLDASKKYILTTGAVTPILLDQLTNAKVLVIKSDYPLGISINGNSAIPCDPLALITNSDLVGAITSLSIQRLTSNTTNVTIIARS